MKRPGELAGFAQKGRLLPMSMILRKKPLNDREELVLRLRAEGKSWKEIGGQIGRAEESAKLICRKATVRLKEYEENPEDGMALLPSLVKGILGELGYTRRSQVLADIESGKLWWDKKASDRHWDGRQWIESKRPGRNLARMRNFGTKSWRIVCEWLGLPVPEPRHSITCPHCGGKIAL